MLSTGQTRSLRSERGSRFRLCWKEPRYLRQVKASASEFSKSLAIWLTRINPPSPLTLPPFQLSLPEPDPLVRDSWILYQSPKEYEREEAAKRLARRIRTNFSNPTVQSAFYVFLEEVQLAGQNPKEHLYERIIPSSFHLLRYEFDRSQSRIRFGKAGPTLKNVKPSQLTPWEFTRWLLQSANRAFQEDLLYEAYGLSMRDIEQNFHEQTIERPDDRAPELQSHRHANDAKPLDALIAAGAASDCKGEREDKKSRIPALLRLATQRDSQVVNELLIVFREQPSIRAKEAVDLVATNLGLNPSNKRQILFRLRKAAAASN